MAAVFLTRQALPPTLAQMLLDRALRAAFRNFWTLFLLVAVVTVTVHLVYGFFYRDVLELRELHLYIRFLSPSRQVRGVGAPDLEAAESAMWWVVAVELALLPVLVLATRRVLVQDEDGAVPTVPDALRHLRDRRGPLGFRLDLERLGTLLIGAALGFGVWYLAQQIGLLVVEPLPDRLNFAALGLVRGCALALGAPFLLAALVLALLSPTGAQTGAQIRNSA